MKRLSLFQLFVHVFLMKVPYFQLRDCMRRVEKHGLELPYNTLISHHLAGGRMTSLVDGLIYAHDHGIKLDVLNAAARDLIGAFGSKITLTEHIQIAEHAGYRDMAKVPFDTLQVKNAYKSPEPTPGSVTPLAGTRVAPPSGAAALDVRHESP
jgi:hypothetical protein